MKDRNEQLNICMILMNEFTHDARVNKEIKTLQEEGYRIVVIALKSRETPYTESRDYCTVYRMGLTSRYLLPKGQFFFFIKYIELVVRMLFFLRNSHYDIFHVHDLETLPIGFLLSKIHRKPIIYDSHELYTELEKHNFLSRNVWRIVERRLAPKTDATILTTESRGQIYYERYGVESPIIIKNTQYYRPMIKSNLLRELHGIPNNVKIVLYQGLIEKNRGLDVMVESMKKLSDVVLVIMGYGSYREKLIKNISNCSWNERTFVLDAVAWEDLPQYTASADLGLSLVQNTNLNNYTMLSNKLFEYLTAGLPVVFPNFPEWNTFILKYGVGLVVDETNPETVADAIQKIFKNKDIYKSMSMKAIHCVKNHHNWEKEGEKLLKLYRAIIR